MKTDLGMDEKLGALLTYVLGFVTGIVFLIIEKKNKFVRFHAMQSTIFFGGLFVVQLILGVIPIIGWLLNLAISIYEFIMWIVCMIKAYNGEKYELPIAGKMAKKYVK